MFCEKCGGELRQDKNLLVCQKCGAEYGLDYSEGYNATYSVGGEQIVPHGFASKRNIIIIVIAALLVFGGIGAAVAFGVSQSASQSTLSGFQLAEKYLSEQNYEQAIIAFEQILKIEPMNVNAYIGLADAYIGMGDEDKALEVMQKGLELTNDAHLQTRIDEVSLGVGSSSTSASGESSTPSASSTLNTSSASVIPPTLVHKIKTIDDCVNGSWQVSRDKNPKVIALNDNYMALVAHEQLGRGAKIFRIEVDRWERTGEISFSEVDAGDDYARDALSRCTRIITFANSCYEIYEQDNHLGSFDVREKNGKLFLYVSGHGGSMSYYPPRADGYNIVQEYSDDYSNSWLLVIPPAESGKATVKVTLDNMTDMVQCSKGEVLGVALCGSYVYAINIDGTYKIIDNEAREYYFLWNVPIWVSGNCVKIFGKDGEVHNIPIDSSKGITGSSGNDFEYIIGQKTAQTGQPNKYIYRLIDLNDGKILTSGYDRLEPLGNGIYFAETENNGCGFIDGTDKKLAWFDDADIFLDENRYAPVVKDGKGWLIDMNMNRVSEVYDATSVAALDNEIFVFITDDKKTFVKTAD